MTWTSVWMRGAFSFIAVTCERIRKNPKLEIRNPKQIRMMKIQKLGKRREFFCGFRIFLRLFRISTFGFRIFRP